MNLRKALGAVASVVADEAANNPEFRTRLEAALGLGIPQAKARVAKLRGGKAADVPKTGEERKGGRRAAPVLDPVEVARQGEGVLRQQLAGLELDRLLDIVAQYGMDPGKLVMKWKDKTRIADRIVEIAMGRATKGDAFRAD